jgi:hypothetical protein
VHRATDVHRGLVFLDTGPGGTRFTIVLPRAARAMARFAPGTSSATVLT